MSSVYNWADDNDSGMTQAPPRPVAPPRQAPPRPRQDPPATSSRAARVAGAAGAAAGGFAGGLGSAFTPPINVHVNGGGRGGGNNGGGRNNDDTPASGSGSHHRGDGMISAIERIEFRNEKDIIDLAKAINRLGRELHFIISMRAEEINGVLSTYKGHWYTFGASSRVKARLVSAHLKVSAEAAKALGVGALKMAHAFDRHFIKPEQDARNKQRGAKQARPQFTIGDE
ncbi:hypothetical protein [Streptomyces resistomycificus]|uniref:Uncharacterized protein n=1 Tax=Streptomyces resistomycificus TaxID=67356 RepID=A0A0L8L503_9ACTN|nr:hypothetical protein [Streptomyces resistomycificus]KOG33303.1 hypothetical protein ADK37_23270 [Streptomyces resistomycificus]KUN99507.1 hypothetical protein AQJ84_11205 [Streptomyces resistomycificus]